MPTTKTSKPRALSPLQERFVVEYVKDYNGTQAAIRAGYSPKSAAERASALLKHPDVAPYIKRCADRRKEVVQESIEKAVERFAISSERTLQTMADVAYFDPRRFVNVDGSTKKLNELDDQSAMAVAGFETTEKWVGKGKTRRKEVKTTYRLVSRTTSLDMAAKVTGEYKADHEQRRSAHEMTDEEILARIATLSGMSRPPGTPLQ